MFELVCQERSSGEIEGGFRRPSNTVIFRHSQNKLRRMESRIIVIKETNPSNQLCHRIVRMRRSTMPDFFQTS